MKFDTINVERNLRDIENAPPLFWKQTLIRNVMDGQDRRHVATAPSQVGRSQTARPVVDVQRIRHPGHTNASAGNLRGCQRESCKANVIVGPIEALRSGIRTSRALIK